jgi:transcription antitermination protein NusB
MELDKKPNSSLQKKSAARMAAVQCLYRQAMNDESKSSAEQVAVLKTQLKNNRNEQKLQVGIPMEPDYAMLGRILDGIAEWQYDINVRLDGALAKDWTRERMGPLMVAVLQCGIFELFFDKDLSGKIIADEYTRLARSFMADDDVNFVHAILKKLAESHG